MNSVNQWLRNRRELKEASAGSWTDIPDMSMLDPDEFGQERARRLMDQGRISPSMQGMLGRFGGGRPSAESRRQIVMDALERPSNLHRAAQRAFPGMQEGYVGAESLRNRWSRMPFLSESLPGLSEFGQQEEYPGRWMSTRGMY